MIIREEHQNPYTSRYGVIDVTTDSLQSDGSVVEKKRKLEKGALFGEEVMVGVASKQIHDAVTVSG